MGEMNRSDVFVGAVEREFFINFMMKHSSEERNLSGREEIGYELRIGIET